MEAFGKRKLAAVTVSNVYAIDGAALPAPTDLAALLSVFKDGLPGDYATQQRALWEAAAALMAHFTLNIAGEPHGLAEIEAYIHHEPTHRDTYTHCFDEQLAAGCWYFHRVSANGGYKGGTYKGMDLAMGNRENKVYGGFLIRSVIAEKDRTLVEGPCLVVDHILALNKKKDIAAFVDGRKVADLKAASLAGLHLQPRNKDMKIMNVPRPLSQLQVYAGSRVGLAAWTPQYCTRAYRFSPCPHLLKKLRGGFAAHMALRDAPAADIQDHLNISARFAKEYRDATLTGRADGDPKGTHKASNNKDTCTMVGAQSKVF